MPATAFALPTRLPPCPHHAHGGRGSRRGRAEVNVRTREHAAESQRGASATRAWVRRKVGARKAREGRGVGDMQVRGRSTAGLASA